MSEAHPDPLRATPHPDAEKPEKDYRFMTALDRGLSVLTAFPQGNRPLGNAEIAERVGLPKPTVTRITYTLTALGYLRYDTETKRYRLGPGVLSLGYNVLAQMEVRDIARPLMQDLANAANASVYLGVRDGLDIVYVEACRAPESMVIRLGVGSRVPLAETGIGRAYLAALDDAALEPLMEKLAKVYGDAWPDREATTRAAIAEARRTGFATTIGGWIPEANSAGAAILDAQRQPVYAINIGGLQSIVSRERLESDLGPRLVALAREIERAVHALEQDRA